MVAILAFALLIDLGILLCLITVLLFRRSCFAQPPQLLSKQHSLLR